MAGVDNVDAIMPEIYEALDLISREVTGMIGSVTMSASAERAAVGQSITVDLEQEILGVDAIPSMNVPEAAAQTPETVKLEITKSRSFPFQITGDVQKVYNSGVGWVNGRTNRIFQALRAATNEVETDLTLLYPEFSRALGVPGTTPFGTDLSPTAELTKALTDNGAPLAGRNFIIDTTAGLNLRKLEQLTDVNRSGDTTALRQGNLLNVHGFDIKESAQIQNTPAGTGTAYLVNKPANLAVGDTLIDIDTGSGTILAGDIVTFAGDVNQYVVAADVGAGTVIQINRPGLRTAVVDGAAVTILATATRNLAFNRSAILLAARPVAMPEEGDEATDVQTIVDPATGMPFEIAFYKGYKMNRWEINLAWGAKVIKPEHTALYLG